MASSWFKGLSSILSRKSKKKLVIEKPLSRFSRYLALERLEDRLNMDNLISFVGGVITGPGPISRPISRITMTRSNAVLTR